MTGRLNYYRSRPAGSIKQTERITPKNATEMSLMQFLLGLRHKRRPVVAKIKFPTALYSHRVLPSNSAEKWKTVS